MPRNILYHAVHQLQSNSTSSNNPIPQAELRLYQQTTPYYLIPLPQTNQTITLHGQVLTCQEHHLTIFSEHEVGHRASDLHYTITFNNQSKCRVFIDPLDEPTGDLSFHQIETHESITLNAQEHERMISYAVSQLSPRLRTLRQAHQALIVTKRAHYEDIKQIYLAAAFNQAPVSELVHHAQTALDRIRILLAIDNTAYQQKQAHHFLAILNGLENPAEVNKTLTTVLEPILSDTSEDEPLLSHPQAMKIIAAIIPIDDLWDQLKTKAAAIACCYHAKSIPSIVQGQVNPNYVQAVIARDNAYRLFLGESLIFEDAHMPSSLIPPHEWYLFHETIEQEHHRVMTQCLKTLLSIPSHHIPDRENLLNTRFLAYFSPESEDTKLFRILIKRDNADLMRTLLMNISFQSTLLSSPSGQTITLLEEMIQAKAIACLKMMMREGHRLNFLEHGVMVIP